MEGIFASILDRFWSIFGAKLGRKIDQKSVPGALRRSQKSLELSWSRLGGVLGRLEGVLGVSWSVSGVSWNVLDASWGILERLGAVLELSWIIWGRL